MAVPEEINADMLAFWNGKGGDTWVARQDYTDITLMPVTDALLAFAAPRAGEAPGDDQGRRRRCLLPGMHQPDLRPGTRYGRAPVAAGGAGRALRPCRQAAVDPR